MTEQQGGIRNVSTGGFSGTRPFSDPLQFLVAPATADELNTVRLGLSPIACWLLDDIRFDFDSSFVLPGVRGDMPILADLIAEHTGKGANPGPPPLCIFGHADPTGNDEYNKFLSGRRAAAVYGLLTRRDEVWEDIFSDKGVFTHPAAGDKWGVRSLQFMLGQLVGPLTVNGQQDAATRQAIRDFQAANGLAVDGIVGPATRKKLFQSYMDAICVNARGEPFRVDRQEGFLARGVDAAGKGDFQGCGEFNPLLIFSKADNTRFERATDKSERNAANAPNRRVMALLFRPGSRIDSGKWPCPRAKEGSAGCIKRFFSDAETRRGTRLENAPRKFEQTKDTFACRFYQRAVFDSPCEQILTTRILVRVVPQVFTRHGNVMAFVERVDGQPLPQVDHLRLGSTQIEFAFTAPNGRLFFRPPVDGDATITQGFLAQTQDRLVVESPVTYTSDPAESARSLRQQMAALRECGEQRVARGRLDGESAEQVRSIHSVVIGDGHCRFADALDRVHAADRPANVRGGLALGVTGPSSQNAPAAAAGGRADQALEGFGAEHGAALDSFFRSQLAK